MEQTAVAEIEVAEIEVAEPPEQSETSPGPAQPYEPPTAQTTENTPPQCSF